MAARAHRNAAASFGLVNVHLPRGNLRRRDRGDIACSVGGGSLGMLIDYREAGQEQAPLLRRSAVEEVQRVQAGFWI